MYRLTIGVDLPSNWRKFKIKKVFRGKKVDGNPHQNIQSI